MRQKLGQHFLKNPSISQEIVASLQLKKGDVVMEVGPGHGELTQLIATNPVRLIAIEKDPVLSEGIKERFKEQPSIEIIEEDILKFLHAPIAKKILNTGAYKMVGNLPYYLTGYLLRTISELDKKPERAVFMVQKEVAERIVAKPPHMNRLAAAVQYWSSPAIVCEVPRTDFDPPPEVDSAVLILKTKMESSFSDKKDAKYYQAVQALFAQPRKTVLNNLKTRTGNALDILESCRIEPSSRPQDLSIETIKDIAKKTWG